MTGHFLSHKYWIFLFVLFSNTTFSQIIKNKQNLIRYCNASFHISFWNGKTEKLCQYFINYLHIVAVSVLSLLSLLASCCCCWCLCFVALSSKSSLSESHFCRCFVVVGIIVPSCGCVSWLLRLVGGGVLSLSLAAASPQLKLTYHFVHKFQQVIGTIGEVPKRVLALFFLRQVPGLSNLCTFELANGLARIFISRYWVRAK